MGKDIDKMKLHFIEKITVASSEEILLMKKMETTIQEKGFYGIIEMLEGIKEQNNEVELNTSSPNKLSYIASRDSFEDVESRLNSGIYTSESIDGVRQDYIDHPLPNLDKESETPNENQGTQEITESKTRVLKQNPWQDLRRVSPNSSEE